MERRTAMVVLGLLAALFVFRLGAAPLHEPDEGRYSAIPREMLAAHDLVTPRLNGVLYFEKPPLYYWLNAASISVLGMEPWTVRLWSALFGFATVLLTFYLAYRLEGVATATWAAAALGGGPLFVVLARLNVIDMTLTFLLTATLVSVWLAHRGEGRSAHLWWHGAFLAAALAVLAKGLIGVVLPGLVAGAYLLATRQWRALRAVPWATGAGLFLVVAVPWHLVASLRNPDFAWFYFIHEHVLRFATAEAGRSAPAWLFLAVVAAGCLPWTGLVPALGRVVPRGGWKVLTTEHPQVVFLLSWFGLTLLFFSASRSKLATYIAPALPPLAVLVGGLVARLGDGRLRTSRLERLGLGAAALLVAAGGIFAVVVGTRGHPWLTAEGASLPVLVPVGVLIVVAAAMVLWGATCESGTRMVKILFASALVLGVATAEAWVVVGRQRSVEPVVEALRSRLRPDDQVFTYRSVQECLWAYLQRPVGQVECQDELEFGIARLPEAERVRRFPSAAAFRPIWESEQRVWVVVMWWGPGRMRGDSLRPGTKVWSNGRWTLLSNQPPESL
ncbi:MAG TPA: phospholipid carrier-dependent glycosyltransferase, partial [Thermoanaerobaculaceae bacterium]|nr:phospholipid carrier-dependent glycosyltransferase [Thermoanaerobaculaceae bacterium]